MDIYIVQIDYMSVSDILLSTIPLQKSNVILHPQTTCIRFDLSGCVSIKCHLHIYRFIGHKLHFVVRLFSRAIYMKSGWVGLICILSSQCTWFALTSHGEYFGGGFIWFGPFFLCVKTINRVLIAAVDSVMFDMGTYGRYAHKSSSNLKILVYGYENVE